MARFEKGCEYELDLGKTIEFAEKNEWPKYSKRWSTPKEREATLKLLNDGTPFIPKEDTPLAYIPEYGSLYRECYRLVKGEEGAIKEPVVKSKPQKTTKKSRKKKNTLPDGQMILF